MGYCIPHFNWYCKTKHIQCMINLIMPIYCILNSLNRTEA
jgi:hypothetical protein